MNFFKRFITIKKKDNLLTKNEISLPLIEKPFIPKERYPENVKGDFYVENQVCITCGAPEAEAPDLIEHSKLEYGHCYFKKQPTTADELDRAISAMQVSCIAGVRYGGKDKAILKKLYDLGLQAECDSKLDDL
jgi:hypothetical protein